METNSVYSLKRLKQPGKIDGNWDKSPWQQIEAVTLNHSMGNVPAFKPFVQAKITYDSHNLYVIFNVNDRFVRCVTNEINGPVWEDSCVELFFAPDANHPMHYFNLEINCGGTPLMYHNILPGLEYTTVDPAHIRMIEIAHSLPPLIPDEIKTPVSWTIEYRVPVALLEEYAPVTRPVSGVEWKGNFYKIADKTSNPHYLTWSPVINPVPNFHLPQFFGTLRFQ
jgi:hypothetical protein